MTANHDWYRPGAEPRQRLFGPILCPPRHASRGNGQDEGGGPGGNPDSSDVSVGVWVVVAGIAWGAFAVLSPVLGGLPF